jgi:hypothetical protein
MNVSSLQVNDIADTQIDGLAPPGPKRHQNTRRRAVSHEFLAALCRIAPMWSIANIADALEVGLAREANRLDAEQAVYGLDSCDELSLQPQLAQVLRDAGYGAYREERYPAYRANRRESEGERCDLVLTPNGRPLAAPDEPPTLFDPPDAVPLADAFWMEVKVVAQFTTRGPNRRYSSIFSAVRRDITKLSKEPGIAHGALLVVLFVQDKQVADHDLRTWTSQCKERGHRLGRPALRGVAVGDRMGNALCRLALYPVHPSKPAATMRTR